MVDEKFVVYKRHWVHTKILFYLTELQASGTMVSREAEGYG